MTPILLNKVTWYTKLIALMIFIILPFLAFYLGLEYGKVLGEIKAMQGKTYQLNVPFTLKVGQTASVEGLTIALNRIVEDSRCPTDRLCEWSGWVVAELTLDDSRQSKAIYLTDEGFITIENYDPSISIVQQTYHFQTDRYQFGDYQVKINDVLPERKTDRKILQDRYLVTFNIKKDGQRPTKKADCEEVAKKKVHELGYDVEKMKMTPSLFDQICTINFEPLPETDKPNLGGDITIKINLDSKNVVDVERGQ